MEEIYIVPEPKRIESSGKKFVFDGFEIFPEFLMREFNLPRGDWKIIKIDQSGTGVEVKDKEITIWGDESIGYATILQLVKQGKGYLPEARITESLRFRFRGYHLDIARGAVPKLETFKKILRLLFLLKYNYFAIYFEDLFPWKKYPQIGKDRGRLTEYELREIIEYGKNLGIEVFPSLELSAHMENILSIPEFRKFSEWYRIAPLEACLDVSNEEAREFTYDLLKEVIEFFPSKYVHIGGDETWALGKGKSLRKTWRFEGTKLYELHHRNMIEIVKKSGKIPVLWGDMISGSILMGEMISKEFAKKWAELIESETWKEVIIANWDYQPLPKEHFKERIKVFKERGIQQIACTGLRNSGRFYPDFERAIENAKNFLTAAREENLMGFLVTAWGCECLFSFLDPLLLVNMEFAEGDGRWKEKWMAISGENEQILEARILFGKEFCRQLKNVIFKDSIFNRMSDERKEKLKSLWEEIIKKIDGIILPDDLHFIRILLEIGIRILNKNVKASDFIFLSNLYSMLWLKERKPEGLDRMVSQFWGTAGREDAKLKETRAWL